MKRMEDINCPKRIVIEIDGPYMVEGGIPLVRKIQIVSEHGEPLTWRKIDEILIQAHYELCRCGRSKTMPFCDFSHAQPCFDGTETADFRPISERQATLPDGTRIVVRRDTSVCSESGFCADRFKNVDQMLPDSADSVVRARIMAMIERCPSGSYTYAIEPDGPEIEPDLPQQIAIVIEITSEGPINGPLWVTGRVPVERCDGKTYEPRNRVTLCACGRSKNKPFCDGTHRTVHYQWQEKD
jgi:CDGSH-type Zn-finger protein